MDEKPEYTVFQQAINLIYKSSMKNSRSECDADILKHEF